MTQPKSVRVGRVRRPVGLRGEVLVEPLTDHPGRFVPGTELQVNDHPVVVAEARDDSRGLLLRFRDIDDVDAARKLQGAYLEVDAADVLEPPPGSHYHWQLIGLEVVGPDGARLGELVDVLDYPANDVYVVKDAEQEILVPAVAAVVKAIDLERGQVVVDMPKADELR